MFGRLGEENIPEEGQVPATAAEEDVLGKIWLELVEFGDADLGDSVAEHKMSLDERQILF